jgi:predicted metal-binding membrane protein
MNTVRLRNTARLRNTVRLRTAALSATLGIAAAAWAVTLWQANGMDMGVATQLGPLAFFVPLWIAMMAAMMLPGAAPAVVRSAEASGRARSVPAFLSAYLAVWTLVGLAVYALYRPHAPVVAGVVAIAAGVYELTPLKRRFRERCRDSIRSGFVFGLYCVGSSIGLMLLLVTLSVMSIPWMALIAIVVVAQKLVPPRRAIDIAVGVAIIALGVLIVAVPAWVPGLLPHM